MSLFKELVKDPLKKGLKDGNSGIPLPLKTLNKYTNNINKGQFIAIGGKANSGKTSFMDFVYMMNVYKWWKNEPEETRPPLKFIYFNMKHSLKNKYQKWVCLFLKLEYNKVIDINTLNNGVGKLYDLDDETQEQILTAESFFEEMEDHNVLEIISGQQTPTSILNCVRNSMLKCGTLDAKTKKYKLFQENEKQLTMVFVDTAAHLLTESDGFNMMNGEQLKKKLCDYINEFKTIYNITTCVVTDSRYVGRTVKENEPNYKEIGIFGLKADLAMILYNSYNEGNNHFLNYDARDFILSNKNRLRIITIVRNVNGIENLAKGLIFFGENGYFAELPQSHEIGQIRTLLDAVSELP